MTWGEIATVVAFLMPAGSTWRYMLIPGPRGAVDVMTVVELAAMGPPICVPAPPEHLLPTHATEQRKIVNVGALPVGFEMVMVYDRADNAIDPVLVTVEV